jgi:hypothetical protein
MAKEVYISSTSRHQRIQSHKFSCDRHWSRPHGQNTKMDKFWTPFSVDFWLAKYVNLLGHLLLYLGCVLVCIDSPFLHREYYPLCIFKLFYRRYWQIGYPFSIPLRYKDQLIHILRELKKQRKKNHWQKKVFCWFLACEICKPPWPFITIFRLRLGLHWLPIFA